MQKYELTIFKTNGKNRSFRAYGVDHLVQMLDTINKYGNKVFFLQINELEVGDNIIDADAPEF